MIVERTTIACNTRLAGLYPRRLIIACTSILLMFVASFVQANETTADASERQKNLEMLFGHTGIEKHLSWVYETVENEALAAWQMCGEEQKSAEFDRPLEALLSSEVLTDRFLQELDDRIDESELTQIVEFMASDVGVRMIEAEAASVDLDDEQFSVLLAEQNEAKKVNEERVGEISQMLQSTGAAYFLSALNTELSSLVSMASVCSNEDEQMIATSITINNERGAEALYRAFLRKELVMPAVVVYRDLSSEDLNDISDFAKSEAGNAYYAAQIQGVRAVLAGQLEELKLAIQETPASK